MSTIKIPLYRIITVVKYVVSQFKYFYRVERYCVEAKGPKRDGTFAVRAHGTGTVLTLQPTEL